MITQTSSISPDWNTWHIIDFALLSNQNVLIHYPLFAYLQLHTYFDSLMYILLRALYFFPRPLEFPGLLCDIRGVERSRAGPCVAEWVTNTNANVTVG